VTWHSLLVQLLNGLASASSLFLVAVGLSLIFGVSRIVNFAHGSLYMLGIYLAYSCIERFGAGTALGFWGGGGGGRMPHRGSGCTHRGHGATPDLRGT
jgi:branched-chain amino acid transport system permease protein